MVTISIVIPVLNAEYQIRDCITSLINQDFPKDQYDTSNDLSRNPRHDQR